MPRNNQARQLELQIEPETDSEVVAICPACRFRLLVSIDRCPRCKAVLNAEAQRRGGKR